MKQELDKLLCEKYPKMMVNRNKDMKETCMCWGFECGDGWFNLLNQLMGNIQHHIDWKERQREVAIKFNRMTEQLKAGDSTLFDEEYKDLIGLDFKEKRKQELIDRFPIAIPEPIPQVTLDQVKEKFGTLRFYYSGGDDYISGMVTMAESMSGVICEDCGNPGERKGGGWVRTICEPCETKREEERAKQMAEYEEQKILKQGMEQ
jgi:hypothetical protein